MRLLDLVDNLDVKLAGSASSHLPGDVGVTRICDITEDSRTVLPGSLFIARSGTKADGNAYAGKAVAGGAVAVLTDDPTLRLPEHASHAPVLVSPRVPLVSALLAERFYGHPGARLALMAVTGTNGKTTVSSLVWQLLNRARTRCGLVGTVLVDDGVEVARAMMTTPPAIEISRTLARMHEAGCTAAAMEVSSHALDQERVAALRFRVAAFTNLTGDHLDYHGTMERYADAKARLFTLLRDDGVAIVNAQDEWCERMVRGCERPVLRVGVVEGDAPDPRGLDAFARVHAQSLDGMDMTLRGPWGACAARVPLVGRYNAMNVLIAFASALELGVPLDEAQRGLGELRAPAGRLERVTALGAPFAVFVDYAHTDDALRNVLRAVAGVMPGHHHAGARMDALAGSTHSRDRRPRLHAVFGCGGDRDRTKRPRMGLAACEEADAVVVTSDNPRTERPSDIIDQILAGMPAHARERVSVQVDRAHAIRHAILAAREGDVVVIAGKGHETEQILPDGAGGTRTIPFDDREHARLALAEVGVPVLEDAAPPARVRRTRAAGDSRVS